MPDSDRKAPLRRPTLIAVTVVAALTVGVAAGAATTARFSDIEDHWAKSYIEWAADNDIISGKADGSFQPSEKVTRAQLAAYLYRYDQYRKADGLSGLSITEARALADVTWSESSDGNWYGTSAGFDNSHTWDELTGLARSLCETMGDAPASASLRDMRQVIPDWLDDADWNRATDYDKWQVLYHGMRALCPEYQSVYDVWVEAGWPGLDFS